MIRSFDGMTPQIAESAHVDETAVVVGEVTMEPDASVWPNATVRGDGGHIRIGEAANVQDNAVLHDGAELAREAAVGHCGIVHGASVAREALVGMNAVVLDDAEIGAGAIVGAGAVVTEGTVVPPETLVVGVPAEPKKQLDGDENSARGPYYAELATRHAETSRRIDGE
jgi:carbonic anhydrase/acetyltransferase-like protein (isoleucine patch superfamily)